jgi:death on curing protein
VKLSEVDFLETEEVERLHDVVVAASGGATGLRDPGLLDSAVAAPKTSAFGQLAYGTLANMAGALAHRLAKNHAFVDGNKRTAASAASAFLRINGFAWTSKLSSGWTASRGLQMAP